MIPTGYTGKPFTALPMGHSNTIPGTIHMADYDLGGPGVAFCHGPPMGSPPSMCGGGNFNDWRPAGTPQYRPTPAGDTSGKCNAAACDDNDGLCHMNAGEPDDNPMGMPIQPYDVYPCYTNTGQWINITVQVMAAGTYTITGLIGAPRPNQNAQPHIRFDFGGGCITSGDIAVPTSICGTPDPGCTEGYHVWQTDPNLATVTFTTPGTYLMTWTLTASFINIDYFVFTKM